MLDRIILDERIENDGEQNRVVLVLREELPLLDYQVDMIRMNRVPFLLPVETRRTDGRCHLYYTVTGSWQLKDLLDNKRFSGREYALLIENLMNALTGAEVYLLDTGQFVLDERHIYLNDALEPQLMVLPVSCGFSVHQPLKELLLQMTVHRAQIREDGSGPLLSGILNALKQEPFNLYEFQKRFRVLGHGEAPPPPSAVPDSLHTLLPPAQRGPAPAAGADSRLIPAAPEGETAGGGEEEQKRHRRGPGKPWPLPVLAALGFQPVLALGLYGAYGPILGLTEDFGTTAAALGLLAVCIDGLMLRALSGLKRSPSPAPRRAPGPKSPGRPEPAVAAAVPKGAVNFHKQRIGDAAVAGRLSPETEALLPPAASGGFTAATEVLTVWEAPPYLIRSGAVRHTIPLKQTAMVLGRQEDLVDTVVDDPTVGRMHAELRWENGRHGIRDMNSKNGTYINGHRLTGQDFHPIAVGDAIRLGSVEYRLVQD